MPKRVSLALLLVGLSSLPDGALRAQEAAAPASLSIGQRTRVTLERSHSRVVGELVSVDSAAIALRSHEGGMLMTIGWAEVARLDVSAGHGSELANTGRGLLYGFAVGAGLGTGAALISWMSNADEECEGCIISPSFEIAMYTLAATAVTTLVGGIIGASWPTERWKRVPFEQDRPRMVLRPLPAGRMALGISVGSW